MYARGGLRLLQPNKACQSDKGLEESRKAKPKSTAQRETSRSIFQRQIRLKVPVPISIKKRAKNKQVRDLLPSLTRAERIRHMLTTQTHTGERLAKAQTERAVRDQGEIG